MSVPNTATLHSVNKTEVTESQVADVIIQGNLCSYQIGLKFGISPTKVREIGQKYMGIKEYAHKENLLVEELQKTIALYVLTGKPKSYILKECGISNYAFDQLSNSFIGNNGLSAEQITRVVDDNDCDYELNEDAIDDIAPVLKSVSLKYLDFELNYTTEADPEESIIAICKFLIGGNGDTA